MKNLVIAFTFLLFCSSATFVNAQEVDLDLDDRRTSRDFVEDNIPESKDSLFEDDESLVSEHLDNMLDEYDRITANESRGGEEAKLFECNDEKFGIMIRNAVTKYIEANPQLTSLGKRKHKLLIREFEHFTEIPADNVTSKYGNLLASEVIKLKINEKIGAEDMKICKAGKGYGGGDMYVFMYKQNHYVNVRILNVAYSGDLSALFFKY